MDTRQQRPFIIGSIQMRRITKSKTRDKLVKKLGISYGAYMEIVGSRLSRWRRQKVARLSEAQGHRCVYCSREVWHIEKPIGFKKNQQATLEHFVPQIETVQTNKDENLYCACRFCNSLRGCMDAFEFYELLISGEIIMMCEEVKKRIQRKKNSVNRYIRRQANQEEKDPKKYEAKIQRTFELAWIIVNVWPESVPMVLKFEDQRLDAEDAAVKARNKKYNKIKSVLDEMPLDRIAA